MSACPIAGPLCFDLGVYASTDLMTPAPFCVEAKPPVTYSTPFNDAADAPIRATCVGGQLCQESAVGSYARQRIMRSATPAD